MSLFKPTRRKFSHCETAQPISLGSPKGNILSPSVPVIKSRYAGRAVSRKRDVLQIPRFPIEFIRILYYKIFSDLTSMCILLFMIFIACGVFEQESTNRRYASSTVPSCSFPSSAKYLPLFLIFMVAGVYLSLHSHTVSILHLGMTLLFLSMAIISLILMACGKAVDALCVFILIWPVFVFEQGYRTALHYWNSHFAEIIGVDLWKSNIEINIYVCLLIFAWLSRAIRNHQRLVPATWFPWIYLLTCFPRRYTLYNK